VDTGPVGSVREAIASFSRNEELALEFKKVMVMATASLQPYLEDNRALTNSINKLLNQINGEDREKEVEMQADQISQALDFMDSVLHRNN
jgi:hypothetical protein